MGKERFTAVKVKLFRMTDELKFVSMYKFKIRYIYVSYNK